MIEIDLASPEAIFEQIIGQIGSAIVSGEIHANEKLPPIRQLAQDLEVNPNTIAKAYQILEEFDVIKTKGRSGSIIQTNAARAFEKWLIDRTKDQLKNVWSKNLSLCPTKIYARKVWKSAIKEIQNEG